MGRARAGGHRSAAMIAATLSGDSAQVASPTDSSIRWTSGSGVAFASGQTQIPRSVARCHPTAAAGLPGRAGASAAVTRPWPARKVVHWPRSSSMSASGSAMPSVGLSTCLPLTCHTLTHWRANHANPIMEGMGEGGAAESSRMNGTFIRFRSGGAVGAPAGLDGSRWCRRSHHGSFGMIIGFRFLVRVPRG